MIDVVGDSTSEELKVNHQYDSLTHAAKAIHRLVEDGTLNIHAFDREASDHSHAITDNNASTHAK